MPPTAESERHLGLLGATGVGVGAIVGGGILALAGAAFAATGPSAIVAFALNGLIALRTALSFAEVGGRGVHDRLLARLLSSLSRSNPREILFLRVLDDGASPQQLQDAERGLRRTADDVCAPQANVAVATSTTPLEEVAVRASQTDLVILGLQRAGRRQKLFGQFALQVARKTACPMLLICRGR